MSVRLLPNPTESPSLCQIKTAQSPRKPKKARRTCLAFLLLEPIAMVLDLSVVILVR